MARKVETILVDDIDGSEAVDSRRFVYNGVEYVIDLSQANVAKFDSMYQALGDWAGYATRVATAAPAVKGRPVKKTIPAGAGGTVRVRTKDRQEHLTEVRNWALANDMDVKSRGRLPATVLAAYELAQRGAGRRGRKARVAAA